MRQFTFCDRLNSGRRVAYATSPHRGSEVLRPPQHIDMIRSCNSCLGFAPLAFSHTVLLHLDGAVSLLPPCRSATLSERYVTLSCSFPQSTCRSHAHARPGSERPFLGVGTGPLLGRWLLVGLSAPSRSPYKCTHRAVKHTPQRLSFRLPCNPHSLPTRYTLVNGGTLSLRPRLCLLLTGRLDAVLHDAAALRHSGHEH